MGSLFESTRSFVFFYRYKKFKNSSVYVGYYVFPSGKNYSPTTPLFVYQNREEANYREISELTRGAKMFEIHFSIKDSEIYIAPNHSTYHSLYHHPVYDNDRQLLIDVELTESGQKLVEQGRRWFVLMNDPKGLNESFIIHTENAALKIIPIEVERGSHEFYEFE